MSQVRQIWTSSNCTKLRFAPKSGHQCRKQRRRGRQRMSLTWPFSPSWCGQNLHHSPGPADHKQTLPEMAWRKHLLGAFLHRIALSYIFSVFGLTTIPVKLTCNSDSASMLILKIPPIPQYLRCTLPSQDTWMLHCILPLMRWCWIPKIIPGILDFDLQVFSKGAWWLDSDGIDSTYHEE